MVDQPAPVKFKPVEWTVVNFDRLDDPEPSRGVSEFPSFSQMVRWLHSDLGPEPGDHIVVTRTRLNSFDRPETIVITNDAWDPVLPDAPNQH